MASRRDRHRRVAHRRGVRPTDDPHRARGRRGKGIGPLDLALRPARGHRRVPASAASGSAATAARPASRSRATASTSSRALQRCRARRAHRRRSRPRAPHRSRGRARRSHARLRVAAAPPRAVRHRQSVADARRARRAPRRAAAGRRTGMGSSSACRPTTEPLDALGWSLGRAHRRARRRRGRSTSPFGSSATSIRACRACRRSSPTSAPERVRIVAGRWRGRTIAAPVGRQVRPTADRVREAWMSIVEPLAPGGARARPLRRLRRARHRGAVARRGVRGSRRDRAHEPSRDSGQPRRCSAPETRSACIARTRCASSRSSTPDAYDVAFADPPYDVGHGSRARRALARRALRRHARHRASRDERLPGDGERRQYGQTAITFYRRD